MKYITLGCLNIAAAFLIADQSLMCGLNLFFAVLMFMSGFRQLDREDDKLK